MAKRKLSMQECEYLTKLTESLSLGPIVEAISAIGGKVFLVGGAVRDLLLAAPLKDLDFEVHNLLFEDVKTILAKFGRVDSVGKFFGVLKFAHSNHFESDWSLPRSDSTGRKPNVKVDPMMTIGQALRRRDLTINAMALDMTTWELHDPFCGERDLEKGILRCADATFFPQDPLRFFRVMQFMGRFEFISDEQLDTICEWMDVSNVSRERIEEELEKLLLKSREPSRAFRWVQKIGRLPDIFPELAALGQISQTPTYHPEGDVFEHTMQVLDAAAEISKRLQSDKDKLALMYAALCHDLGKASTTVVNTEGKITSYGHEEEGVKLADRFLKRFCGKKEVIATVKKLVRYHMIPGNFLQSAAKAPAYKRLARKLAPETNGEMLGLLCEADRRGRNGEGSTPLFGPVEQVSQFLDKMRIANVAIKPEKPLLTGKDFLDVIPPGAELGMIVKMAYEMQIEKSISDKEALKKQVLSEYDQA